MKKIICIIASMMLATTLMVGCKGKTEGAQNEQTTQMTESTQSTSAEAESRSDKPGNFQKADLEGEVASINGSKITLKVIRAPERPVGNQQPAEKTQVNTENSTDNEANKESSEASKETGQSSKTPQKRQVEYTGETKEITIVDGIKITKISRGQQDSEAKELTVNDIQVGDTLQISYSDKEKETISQINVRSAANSSKSTNTK